MKKILIAGVAAIAVAALPSCNGSKGTNAKLTNASDSLSYAIGLDLGDSFEKSDLADLDLNILIKGIKEQLENNPAMELEEARMFIQDELQKRQESVSDAFKVEGQKFLDENKTKEGVMATPSGLQYKVITQGTGVTPAATDTVKVNYHGTLIDGTVFDSSVERGEPVEFPLNQVIPGWTEGVQLMNVGSKYIFYVPQELAYGSRGMGQIKPYSTLIFEVELLDVKPSKN